MRDCLECSAALAPPPMPPGLPPIPPEADRPAIAPIPRIDPDHWEDFAVFRESFLTYFTRPEDNAAHRQVGNLIFEMVLEFCGSFPNREESPTRQDLRAGLADLHHLQGFFRFVGRLQKENVLTSEDAALSRYAGIQAVKLRRIAERLELRLAREKEE